MAGLTGRSWRRLIREIDKANEEAPAPRPDGRLRTLGVRPRTERLYRRELARLDDWGAGRPVDDELLSRWLVIRCNGFGVGVADRVLAAVRWRNLLNQEPPAAGARTHLAMSEIRFGGGGHRRGSMTGIRWEAAEALATAAEREGTLAGARDAAIITAMSNGLLRGAEVCALDVADVAAFDLFDRVMRIRRSKTDRAGVGATVPIAGLTAQRIDAWMEASGITSGPLFRTVVNETVRANRLTTNALRSIIQTRAQAAGLPPGRYGGHSFRIGSAESLAERGASVLEIQLAGRWTSPTMPGRYAAAVAARRDGPMTKYGFGRPSGDPAETT